jgi:hypothetical protein
VSTLRNSFHAIVEYAWSVQARPRGIMGFVAAGLAGSAIAAATATAASPPQTVTLGSTTGTPSQNICVAGIDCTYIPFSGVAAPELAVPFDGTVTRFSLNAGSAGGKVELRVLRPAGGGKFTGAGTGPAETLALGVNTFTVSLPVKAGDVLGLDNDSSALMFDATSPTPITAYYELPPLTDGATAAPNRTQAGSRLLLSATIKASTTSPPKVTNVRQSHRVWREGTMLATFSRKRRAPIGTTFSLRLNEPAQVRFAFSQRLTGRLVGGKCKAPIEANRSRPKCQRSRPAGTLQFAGHAGANTLRFQGRLAASKKLGVGRYAVRISAVSPGQQVSNVVVRLFTIVK